LPLVQYGLKLAGYDARSLTERITDLTSTTEEYKKAQASNMTTIVGLQYAFGSLSQEAKKFYEIQQTLTKKAAYAELASSLSELDSKYKDFRKEQEKPFRNMADAGAFGSASDDLWRWFKEKQLGLTTEQAKHLGDALKDIDKKKPEEAAETLRQISEYIDSSTNISSDFKRTWTETIKPILQINDKILELEKNVRAAQQQASDFNAAMTDIQNKFQPDINAAKRSFNVITAAQLEGKQRIAEFDRQMREKEGDGVDRTKEAAAGRLRIQQETNDKIKDFVKSQSEAYRTVELSNNVRKDQIGLQEQILKLSDDSKLSALNIYQYNQDILQNAYNYKEALVAIAEQRRKNMIDDAQAAKLRAQASDIQTQADKLAADSVQKRADEFKKTQQEANNLDARKLELFNQTATLSDREKKNAQDIFNINEQRLTQLRGLTAINDPAERAKQEKAINDIFDSRIESTKRQQTADLELQQNFVAGWKNAYANYVEESGNAFKRAQSLFATVTKNMEDMFVQFFKTGKLGWKDFLSTVVDALLRSQIQQLIGKTFGGIGNIGGSTGGGGLLGGTIIPGFLAAGGPAGANQPYIVGEKGPELFVPNASGTVVPNNQLASTSVTYNINAVDAISFKQMLAADPSFLHAVAEQGRRRIPGAR